MVDFEGFFALFAVVACLMAGGIIAAVVVAVVNWHKNNVSPVIVAPARVVAKRLAVSGGTGDMMTSTGYYATFELESGSRVEFAMDARAYGQTAEGDFGRLSFQGTRLLSFQRQLGAAPPTDLR